MQRFLHPFLVALFFGTIAVTAQAADLNLEARLVCGADDAKDIVKYKPANPELAEKLHRTFKWKNYYEITNKIAGIPVNHSRDFKMSDTCTVIVKNLGASRLEINYTGRGKQTHKGTYTLPPSQWLVLGGENMDSTAWFIGLRAVDPKVSDLKKAVSKN